MYQKAEDSLATKFSSNHGPPLLQIKSVMKFGKVRSWLCRMHVKREKIKKEISYSIRNETHLNSDSNLRIIFSYK